MVVIILAKPYMSSYSVTLSTEYFYKMSKSGQEEDEGRMRSLSGGTSKAVDHRMSSGDDTFSEGGPSRRSYVFEAFRPRSKSDSKRYRPTFISTLRASGSSGRNSPKSLGHTLPPVYRTRNIINQAESSDYKRPRAGSEGKHGPVSKMMGLIHNRSHSVSGDAAAKRIGATSGFQSTGTSLRRQLIDPEKRRSFLTHGSFDGFCHHRALIHRNDSKRVPSNPRAEKIDIEDLGENEDLIFVKFFQHFHCYDIIPISGKLVVFDTQLLVKRAFFALVENGVRAAPLWDSTKHQFVGMLTITDFIHILRTYYKSPLVRMEELEEHKLETWRNVLKTKIKPLYSIGPEASLYEAIKMLINKKVHRLPVIDPLTGNVLYVLTHKRILKFLFLYMAELPSPSYLSKSLKNLKIGTYENIATIKESTPVIMALNNFVERRVSALPIVNDKAKVVDIYTKFDVIYLAAERTYDNLDITVKKALQYRSECFEGVLTCKVEDKLKDVLEKMVDSEVHRLVIVDHEDHVVGIISLSDILKFLVFQSTGKMRK
ncbi:5'-AMP-activated protein kinase subunit gamma-1-like isoform X3 [Tachypleus tridentatus]|uniref:5'-AMP-activated protein kinase subunit gamma-1-like isoform X3 n=1 Tax=Tachypleus tridentatus TaxID=6853 RepID=UPI003FD510FE